MIRKTVSSLFAATLRLVTLNHHNFSKPKQSRHKVQTVGFSNDYIENMKNLSYKLKEPIKYINGQCMVYKSQFSYLQAAKDYILHLSTLAGLAVCLNYQIYFLVYPVIKHVYVAGVAITMAMMARRVLRNNSVVKEIYLLEGGKATRLVYRNQMKRKLMGQPLEETYYNSLFVQPKEVDSKLIKMHSFPEEHAQVVDSPPIFAYWKKYYSNDGNMMLIPTDYEYIHAEILANIMKGKIISC